jgi:hypothetical protein
MRSGALAVLVVACVAAGADLASRGVLANDLHAFAARPPPARPPPAPAPPPIVSDPLVDVTCIDGDTTVTVANGWHVNREAPWKWDRGERVAFAERSARFVGPSCDGVVRAFICDDAGDRCRGPIRLSVR